MKEDLMNFTLTEESNLEGRVSSGETIKVILKLTVFPQIWMPWKPNSRSMFRLSTTALLLPITTGNQMVT
jgi:hypothetical protein